MNINLFSTPTTSLTANYSLSSIINYSLINFTQQNKTVEKQSRDKNQMFHCITCPLCRKKTNLEGGLEDIHCNIYLANISNYLREFTTSTQILSTSLPTPQAEWDIPLSPKFTGYSDISRKQKLNTDFPPKSCGFDFSYLKNIEDIDLKQSHINQKKNVNKESNISCVNNFNNINNIINNHIHNYVDNHQNNNYEGRNNDLDDEIHFFGEYEEEDQSSNNVQKIIDDEDLVLFLPSPFCPVR